MSARYPDFDGSQKCAEIGTTIFFPEGSGYTEEHRQAQALCTGCPFLDPCGEYALSWKVDGIWAGTTETERKKIRRKRGIVPTALAMSDKAIRAERVREMTSAGLTAEVIAEVLGIDRRNVQRIRTGAA